MKKLTKKQLKKSKEICYIEIDCIDKTGKIVGAWTLFKHPIKGNLFYKILKEYLIEYKKTEKRRRLYDKIQFI